MKFIKKTHLSTRIRNNIMTVAKALEVGIDKIEWQLYEFGFSEFFCKCVGTKTIKQWGFSKKSHNGSSEYLYISKKLGIVIKIPYVASDSDAAPILAIPTAVIQLPNFVGEGEQIWIQPVADVSQKAIGRFLRIWGDWIASEDSDEDFLYAHFGADIHDGNYAMFNKKPVMIDW
jgi:hypothetical protein